MTALGYSLFTTYCKLMPERAGAISSFYCLVQALGTALVMAIVTSAPPTAPSAFLGVLAGLMLANVAFYAFGINRDLLNPKMLVPHVGPLYPAQSPSLASACNAIKGYAIWTSAPYRLAVLAFFVQICYMSGNYLVGYLAQKFLILDCSTPGCYCSLLDLCYARNGITTLCGSKTARQSARRPQSSTRLSQARAIVQFLGFHGTLVACRSLEAVVVSLARDPLPECASEVTP